jgi:hypothetical protein
MSLYGRFSGCSAGTKGRYGLGIGFQICAAKVIKIASAFSCRARTYRIQSRSLAESPGMGTISTKSYGRITPAILASVLVSYI